MQKRYLYTFLSFLILCCGFKGYSQTYCAITGVTSSATYINGFRTTGGITNITNNGTGFSPGGYNNATDKSVTQVNGGSVNFTSTTAGGTVGFTIWVDWNDNGVFDANERVYTSGTNYVTNPSGSFTVPASALPGTHRMRVVADYFSTTPTPCALSAGRGEVEDYTFNVPPKAPTVKASLSDSTDACPANNTCSATRPVQCFPPVVPVGPPRPIDPNYKVVSPMRSLEGGIFPSDEWLTYTVHCQNDGLGICHNAIMVDTIDTSKLDISTLQVLGSWDPVQLRHINANTVAFDFIGVELTSSFDDLPNSQTEVTFKIKRHPGQPVGTEIYNMAGIYFDTNHVVNTNYAASKIIEPCPASQVSPGVAGPDATAANGAATTATFRLTGYDGLITGWEVSTDPTFAGNVTKTYNITDSFRFNDTVNAVTYVRALVQTGGCAITGSQPAVIRLDCNSLIKNGSFEDPALTGTTYAFRKIPNWTNTADNNTMELHRLSLGPAANGSQYIEMNGYTFGNIYQDFTAARGQNVKWSLDHKKRAYANEVITVTLSAPDGSNASAPVQHLATAAWQKVSGSYQLAPGQTQVRIRIVSSGGAAAAGNLLDNVQAQYATCAGATAMRENNEAVGETLAQPLSVIVHPNPVSAMADLRMEGFATGKVSVDVMNSNGQLVHTTDVEYTEGTSIHMDLSHLHQGMYFVRVKQDGKVVTTKMVKN